MKTVKVTILIIVMLLLMALTSCAATNQTGEDKVAKEPRKTEEKAPVKEKKPTDIDYLVVVDKTHTLPDGWEDRIELVSVMNAVGDEVKTEKAAYEAYLKLKKNLESEGVHVDLDSAYRSVEEQQKIIEDFTEKYGADYANSYAAPPGTSEHHTGLALDLFLIVDGNIVYENEDLVRYPEIWAKIHETMPEYGFVLSYNGENGTVYEPWHIRYVGFEAAKEMTEKNLTLEEYIISKEEKQ